MSAGRDELRALLGRCCGSRRWVERLAASAPWADVDELVAAADRAFDDLDREDWLEAFAAHPRIGDLQALRARFGGAKGAAGAEGRDGADAALALAGSEQAGALGASEAVLRALAEGNRRYDRRFGHLFLVFASGKSAEEMLALLEARLHNDPADELRIAAEEQRKIARKRLRDHCGPILSAARSSDGAAGEEP